MSLDLPIKGDESWDEKLNAAMLQLDSSVSSASSAASQAASTASVAANTAATAANDAASASSSAASAANDAASAAADAQSAAQAALDLGDTILGGEDAAVAALMANPNSAVAKAMPFFTPEQFGSVGNGTANDTAAVQAALDAAFAAGGGAVRISKMHGFTGQLIQKSGVAVIGSAGGGETTNKVGFKALDSTAVYRYGYGQGGGSARPGPLMNVLIDGNGAGAAAGLVRHQGIQCHWEGVQILNAAGDALVMDAAQNNTIISCVIQVFGGTGVRMDNGTGGNFFARNSVGGGNRCLYVIDSPAEANAYAVPTHNTWEHCIFEQTNINGYAILDIGGGHTNRFQGCLISANGTSAMSSGAVVRVTGDATSPAQAATYASFNDCIINGGYNAGSLAAAFYLGTPAHVSVSGIMVLSFTTASFTTDGSPTLHIDAQLYKGAFGSTTDYAVTGAGTWAGAFSATAGFRLWNLPPSQPYAWMVSQIGDANVAWRLNCTSAGTLNWRDGSSSTIRAAIARSLVKDGLNITGETSLRLANYTTANRPAANTVPVGQVIYNTTTTKPNYSDGTNWRDAAGTVV